MARSRNIKPAFFKNEQIAELDPYGRLLFIGLWCLADRNGLVEYRPKRIKIELFPYDDSLDINGYIPVMERLGLIHVLTDGDADWLFLPTFTKHQNPHHTERTNYPDPKSLNTKDGRDITVKYPLSNGDDPADSLLLNPDSLTLNPESLRADSGENIYTHDFEQAWKQYPKRTGANPKRKAFKAWNARLKSGVKPDAMIEGISRYRNFIVETGKASTEFVMQAATFLGPDEHYLNDWEIPTQKPSEVRPKNDADWMALGKRIGVNAGPGESMQEYIKRIQTKMKEQNYA